MSSIGLAGPGALNLAGSAAGAQRSGTDADDVKKNASDQKTAADRNSLSTRALGDVAEAENSPERDADGRLPYGRASRPGPPTESDTDRAGPPVPDAAGERGRVLDLEA